MSNTNNTRETRFIISTPGFGPMGYEEERFVSSDGVATEWRPVPRKKDTSVRDILAMLGK